MRSGAFDLIRFLKPDMFCESLMDIDLKALKAKGIEGLLVDLDNTLVEYQKYECTPLVLEWLARVRAVGLQVCIVSNSRRQTTVARFAESAGIPAITRAGKPRRGSFKRAIKMIGVSAESTAIIGDQVFTDVLGGNRLGCYTILVRPVSSREFFGTRLVRILERFVIKKLL